MKRNVTAEKAEDGQQQQIHDMVVRLFALAELLVSRAEDKHLPRVFDDANTDQEAGHAMPQKTQTTQPDV